jgi:hypothetical protein
MSPELTRMAQESWVLASSPSHLQAKNKLEMFGKYIASHATDAELTASIVNDIMGTGRSL